MAATDNSQLPLPRWFLVYAAIISALAVLGLALGVLGTFANNRQDAVDAADAKARDEQQKILLDCFDDFARKSSESSTAVREASVKKDAATAARDDALDDEGRAFLAVVDHILANEVTPADVKALRDSLQARADAAARLDRAQRELDQVREDNPVPPPPSTFCSTR